MGKRIVNRLGDKFIEEQDKKIQELQIRCQELEQKVQEFYQYMTTRQQIDPGLEENVRNNNCRLDEIDQNMMIHDVKIKTFNKQIEKMSFQSGDRQEAVQADHSEANEYSCVDYFDFENHFRGSRDAIKNVQKQYIQYFSGRKNVLDLGCGRGEFLELLQENDIEAVGVECYSEFVEYCKIKGLDVIEDDALTYLEKQDKIGGIFAGQLIEHLKFNQIVKLCELAYEKLEDGAYVVLETPNPMSLAIYTHAFYMDPSHNKPIHPLTMEYFMRKVGFQHVEILFTESSKYPVEIPELISSDIKNLEAFNKSMQEVSKTLFGSQDYAIIARK